MPRWPDSAPKERWLEANPANPREGWLSWEDPDRAFDTSTAPLPATGSPSLYDPARPRHTPPSAAR